jgi:hypothetical protein
MEFQGPLRADYRNVHSLNTAFLELIQDRKSGRRCLKGVTDELIRRLQSLHRKDVKRLAATPFLLFSFRESDDELWQELLRGGTSRDLFSMPSKPSDEAGRLIAAALGFIWQLANRNPFAARLLCGASTHWCEQITERTFFRLLTVAGHRIDLVVLRAAGDMQLWHKLLDTGLSDEKEARRASHISAMQYVLTRQPKRTTFQAAACAFRDPAFKVAEQPKK